MTSPTPGYSFNSRLAIYDRATGVYARWYLELRVDEEFSRALRSGRPITLISLRVDARRAEATARRLRTRLRDYDLVGHFGGGHFVLAVLEAGPEASAVVTDRIYDAIEAAPDVGLAFFPDDGITFESLLECAESRVLSDVSRAA